MNIHSVRIRIVALSTVCVLGATGALLAFNIIAAERTARQVDARVGDLLDRSSRESLERLAVNQAGSIQREVDGAFDAARNMARALEAISDDESKGGSPMDIRRKQLNGLLLKVLEDNPRFNGTYSAWLPNALDDNDVGNFLRVRIGADETGRALPYWTRDAAGKIAVQPLVEYDSRELHPNGVMKGGWFLKPQETGRENILAPLPYTVQGKRVYLATMSVPIKVGGNFVGVAGADFDLSFVQTLAEKVNGSIYGGKGSVTIATNAGLVVASSAQPKAIGGPYLAIDATARGPTSTCSRRDAPRSPLEKATDHLKVFSPIKLGRTDDVWSVVIEVPRAMVMAEADTLSATPGRASALRLLLAGSGRHRPPPSSASSAMALVGHGIASPIRHLTEALGRLAKGEALKEIAGARRRDEIGDIARAVDVIRVGAEEEARRKTASAESERNRQETERRQTMNQLAAEFEQTMGNVVTNVVTASTHLQTAAETMSSATARVMEQSSAAAGASNEAATNVGDRRLRRGGAGLVDQRDQAAGRRIRPCRGDRGARCRDDRRQKCATCRTRPKRSGKWSISSTTSPGRPICWR